MEAESSELFLTVMTLVSIGIVVLLSGAIMTAVITIFDYALRFLGIVLRIEYGKEWNKKQTIVMYAFVLIVLGSLLMLPLVVDQFIFSSGG